MNEAMQKLIDMVQKASPIIWHAAYRQVFVDAAQCFIGIGLLLVAARLILRWRTKLLTKQGDSSFADADVIDMGPVCLMGLAVACYVISACLLFGAMDYVLNPTFAAIKELKGLL